MFAPIPAASRRKRSFSKLCAMLALLMPMAPATAVNAQSGAPATAGVAPAARQPAARRPVIAIVASNDGTELTDFMIPRAVLTEAGIAEVISVARDTGRVRLLPGNLMIDADMTIKRFDASHPAGADYVIVPALKDRENPAIVSWIREQSARGATIVSICEGAWAVAAAGLLEGHHGTSHWGALDGLAKKYPGTTWVWNQRYVIEGRVITTTGVSASLPISIVLIERIAGREFADTMARRIGVASWDAAHDSHAFPIGTAAYSRAMFNTLAWWRHEDVAVPVADGVNEVALALTIEVLVRSARAKPFTWSNKSSITGSQGLHMSVDWAMDGSTGKQLPLPAAGTPPAAALDKALARVEQWYGPGAATLAAKTLEYPRPLAK